MNKLHLHHRHEALGAKFGEFAGFQMPLYYSKPVEEHHRVRQHAGIFDISHMGQLRVTGPRAEDMLAYALPNDVRGMADGDALYSPLCAEDGGVLDDLIIYRYKPTRYRIIVNASTREADLAWLKIIAEEIGVVVEDLSADWCLFAVQGPEALGLLASHLQTPPRSMGYYTFTETAAFGLPVFVARTGYTGEPGCEIAVRRHEAEALWGHLTGELGITPIGLAARDTLRLEAAMALYGHELSLEHTPLESGLAWAVKLDREDEFIGKKAMQALQGMGYPERLVGIEVTGRGIPREGYPVHFEGQPTGVVTSGVLSPTTGKAIALARIQAEAAKVGTPLTVEIRGKAVEAVVTRRPFYQNPALKETG